MELHKKTASAFIEYLERHGYPTHSIVPEWGTSRCSVDIAIVADDGITPVAVYEVKGKKDPRSIDAGINQLKRVRKILNLTVQYSLVFGTEEAPFFEVVDVSKIINNNENAEITSIMADQSALTKPIAYKNVKTGIAGKVVLQKQETAQKRIDHMKPICWLIAAVFVVILVLDAFCLYRLNADRLIMLGGVVIIVLIPFFNEISLQGIFLKRSDDSANKSEPHIPSNKHSIQR